MTFFPLGYLFAHFGLVVVVVVDDDVIMYYSTTKDTSGKVRFEYICCIQNNP